MSRSSSEAESFETESESSREPDNGEGSLQHGRVPMTDKQAPNVRDELRSLSFGALVEAQDAFGESERLNTRRNATTTRSSAEKLDAIRERLAELRDAKKDSSGKHKSERTTNKSSGLDLSAQRISKHAPTELSSKRAVTRKRAVVEVLKNPTHARDPRFTSVSGRVDDEKIRKNYAFLDDYRKRELGELKAAVKKTKVPEEKEQLKKEVMAMENRQRQEAERERERNVLQEHRKREKELIKEGKKPFYLKKSEQKRQALVAKFEGMKGKDRAKTMERRRKKASQREKKSMPAQRRRVGDD